MCHLRDYGLSCAYRQINNLASQATDYENLLKDIGTFVDGRTAERIKGMLDKVCVTVCCVAHV